jgi:transposase
VHAGCWSHAERILFRGRAVKSPRSGGDRNCSADRLAVCHRREARQRALSLEGRLTLRQEQSRRLLGVIRQQIEAARSKALPGGALAKACNYTLTLWDKLTRFLEYHELELSNNLAEN